MKTYKSFKILTIMILICSMFFMLVGCRQCIDVKQEEVEVTIVDEYHRGTYCTPVSNGKTIVLITHPAVYKITVEYEDYSFTISGSDTYNKYCDKVGQTTTGVLEIRTYSSRYKRYT